MSPNTTNKSLVARSVEVTVTVQGRESTMVLGLQGDRDPLSKDYRQIWGVVDPSGLYLTFVAYSVRDANPAMLLRDMERKGHDRFVFHTGTMTSITPEELLRAGRELGIVPPVRYQNTPVPPELFTNWNEIEAEWWRRGVRAAVTAKSPVEQEEIWP